MNLWTFKILPTFWIKPNCVTPETLRESNQVSSGNGKCHSSLRKPTFSNYIILPAPAQLLLEKPINQS